MYDIEQIKIDEGFRSKPYKCTAGKLTIGYGINLEEGISKKEAEAILKIRLRSVAHELIMKAPVDDVDIDCDELEDILINMSFNLGLTRLLKFKRMWSALALYDYKTAAIEMRDSRWYHQVGNRAERLAVRMEALGE